MPDPRFYSRSGPFSLAEIADRVGATLAAGAVAHSNIADVASLDAAGPNDISFLSDPKLVGALKEAHCGACLVKEGASIPPDVAAIAVADPRAAFAKVAAMFYPDVLRAPTLPPAKIA